MASLRQQSGFGSRALIGLVIWIWGALGGQSKLYRGHESKDLNLEPLYFQRASQQHQ